MVKKASNNLTINTATKKEAKKQIILNLSRVISVPITYMLEGKKVSMMIAPTTKEILPEGAQLLTNSEYLKVL